ncbi:MAG: glycosyltransferase family 2 protein [Thermoleophilia bacterium]
MSAADPVVTIVIVTHSVRADLQRCLASIAEHAGLPVRTIVVDNASTDDTLAFVRAHHPDVELVELARNEGTAARDYGLRLAESRYTMFVDSDAALTPGALPAMVAAMDEHPSWGLLGPRLVYDDGSMQLSCRRFPPLLLPVLRRPPLSRLFEQRRTVQRHLMSDFDHARTRPVLYVLGACQLFRTQTARAAGPFDMNVFWGWDDADWCFRIREAGGDVVFFAGAQVVHSYQRTTARKPLSGRAIKQLQAFVYFQRLYWGRRRELIRLSRRLDEASAT